MLSHAPIYDSSFCERISTQIPPFSSLFHCLGILFLRFQSLCLCAMGFIEPFTLLLCWLLAATSTVRADSPFELSWSDESYGPDGPWQAVTVSIGVGAAQNVPLYPGGRWSTYIMSTDICDDENLTVSCDPDSSSLVDMSKLSAVTNVTEPGAMMNMVIPLHRRCIGGALSTTQ